MKSSLNTILIAITLVSGMSCTHEHAETPKEGAGIPDSVIRNVQTAPVVSSSEEDVIKLNGKIQADDAKQAKVFALVSGRIKSVNVEMGDYVHRGQVLAVMSSTEIAGFSSDLITSESNVQLAKKGLETAKDLYDSKLATEQDYLNARITYNNAVAARNKASQIASITGGGKAASYTITSPINGYIIEKNVTSNTEVRPDNNINLFAIADLSDVWVIANVYEADINNISIGDMVKVNTLSDPDKTYSGKIDKVYNVLDPATRTMKVRITMSNPNNELKPEMFATIQVKGKPSTPQLMIPANAIVMDNSRNYVIIRKNGKLLVKNINLINRVEGKAFITGLSEGDEVVTASQVFFYQALQSN